MTQATVIGSTIGVEELERDPYPAYARLRADEPVSWVESVGLWLVTRWDDVNHVIKSPEIFTAETEPSTLNRTFGKNLLGSEGAYHQRIRSIIQPWFRNQAIGHYPAEVIAPLANELIDGFASKGELELASEFAEPLRRWFHQLALGAANFEADPDKQRVADAASREVDETVAHILDRLQEHPD